MENEVEPPVQQPIKEQQNGTEETNTIKLNKKSLKRKLNSEPTNSCKLSKLAEYYGVDKQALNLFVEENGKYFQIEKNEKRKRIVKLKTEKQE